jgi:hypothetical protein
MKLQGSFHDAHLLQFKRGFNLRGMLVNVPLQGSLVDRLPHYACHDEAYYHNIIS